MGKTNSTAPSFDDLLGAAYAAHVVVGEIDRDLASRSTTQSARLNAAAEKVSSVFGNWMPRVPSKLGVNPLSTYSTRKGAPVSATDVEQAMTADLEYIATVRKDLEKIAYLDMFGPKDEAVEALKARRKDVSDKYDALCETLVNFGLVSAEDLPPLPKRSAGGRPKGSGNNSGTSTKRKLHWTLDGKDYQQDFSTFAFHYSERLTGIEGARTPQLRAMLDDQVENWADGFTATFNGHSVTLHPSDDDTTDAE